MDALTSVLRVLRLKATIFQRLPLESPWGIELSASQCSSCHVIDEGSCYLRLPGRDPLPLNRGDVIIVSNTQQYSLTASVDAPSLPLQVWLKMHPKDQVHTPTTVLLCGTFCGEHDVNYPLFAVLPPLILIKGQDGRAADWLTLPMSQISIEAANDYPGSETVISRLLDILFIMVVRYWIFRQPMGAGGWFAALYHPQIGQVLGLMHRQPDINWTVESLAAHVGLSRSSLAAHFSAMVGEPPMKYLTRWRMQIAVMALTDDPRMTIDEIARRVGYESGYAFSKAFKRFMGASPSDYRRSALATSD